MLLLQGHHYISATLNDSTECSVARWDGVAVGFVATLCQPGIHKSGDDRIKHRESRLVIMPGAPILAPAPSPRQLPTPHMRYL